MAIQEPLWIKILNDKVSALWTLPTHSMTKWAHCEHCQHTQWQNEQIVKFAKLLNNKASALWPIEINFWQSERIVNFTKPLHYKVSTLWTVQIYSMTKWTHYALWKTIQWHNERIVNYMSPMANHWGQCIALLTDTVAVRDFRPGVKLQRIVTFT